MHMSDRMPTFAPMFMKAKKRKTKGGEGYIYYTLCGSWRDSQGLSIRDELLHLGRHEDFDVWEMREVADTSAMKHLWSLQIGAERLCVETMKKFRLGEALGELGLTNEQAALALTPRQKPLHRS